MKARIRKTGEIVDVIDYSHWTNRSDADYVSLILTVKVLNTILKDHSIIIGTLSL